MKSPRVYRTRTNPIAAEDWKVITAKLTETPTLEAKTLFEWLQARNPEAYVDAQLRTLQRHVRAWRVAHGPAKNVFFAQQHRAGEAAQTDFTHATELAVTIAGEVFRHMLCVVVLPYSNWQWATVCLSESILALRRGVQSALFQLGHAPTFHQTDNSTAATHRVPKAKREAMAGKKRPFNEDYLALMRHYAMTPRTTAVGEKEQNGDVEASHRALKNRLDQALLMRGSREFASQEAWQDFVHTVVRRANEPRAVRLRDELAVMPKVQVTKLAEYNEVMAHVSPWCTVRVKHCAYSVPSRLIGEDLRVRVHDTHIEMWHGSTLELSCPRLIGSQVARIDYRHVIWSLVRKPAAFARYIYREELFPSVVFRRAYDAIQTPHHGTPGDLEYLRILFLAATTMESSVQNALVTLLAEGSSPTAAAVKVLVHANAPSATLPELASLEVNLASYDDLFEEMAS